MGLIQGTVIHDVFPEELEGLILSRKEGTYEIVDVRQPQEYEFGHIPGARLVPLGEIEERMDEFSVDQDLFFYCRSGARSMAAASLVRDTGVAFRGIHNLVGGIGGYEGVPLSGLPKVEVVDITASLDRILVQTMDMEKGAWRLYTLFQKRFPQTPFASRLNRLGELEKKHASALYTYWEKHVTPLPGTDFETLFASLAGNILEGGESFDAWSQRLEEQRELSCVDLAEAALTLEYAAYDLYRNLAGRVRESSGIAFFHLLSEQEKGHVRVVSKMFESCFA